MTSWIELMEPPLKKKNEHPLKAFCGSWRCAGYRTLVKKENIRGRPVFCPECGSSLVWMRTDKEIVQPIWTK